MSDPAWIAAFAALAVSLFTLFKGIRAGGSRDEGFKKDIEIARNLAAAANNVASAALGKHELLRDEFQKYQVEMAGELAHVQASVEDTARSLVQAETRLIDAINGLATRFDKMTERFDQLLLRRQRS